MPGYARETDGITSIIDTRQDGERDGEWGVEGGNGIVERMKALDSIQWDDESPLFVGFTDDRH